jgi:hypothetical protein
MRAIKAETIALLAVAALAGAGPAIGASAPSAGATLSAALGNAARHGSFRTTESSRSLGREYVSAADVAAQEGQQRVTVSPGWQARFLVVSGVAYIAGNQSGLTQYFGFPAAAARKAGSRWVSIPSSNPGYASASRDVLSASVLAYVTPSGRLTETAPTNIDGKAAIGIRGTGPALRPNGAPSALTLYVSTKGAPLPLRAVFDDKQGDRETLTLSAWNEHVALQAPRDAIPIATLAHG